MAIYKYKNTETPGYFTDFSTIKDTLQRGDKIVFLDGGLTDGNLTDLSCMPGINISTSTTYDKIKKYLFNFSGLKVKIRIYSNVKESNIENFDYWANNRSSIILDCRELDETKSTFFVGLLNRYQQYSTILTDTEDIATKCFNVIPLDENNSLKGLENRRVFVIGSYGKQVQSGYHNTYYPYSKDWIYKFAVRELKDESTDATIKYATGGSGWFGGRVVKSGRYYIPNGGSHFILTKENATNLPISYMKDYQTYADIITGKIEEIAMNDNPAHSKVTIELDILGRKGDVENSTMYYYTIHDGLVPCIPYRYDGKYISQMDAYYFDGDKLIKL